MKMLSCLLPTELAGETELRRLLSLTFPPVDPLSSKGLPPLGVGAFGECGVRSPGLGGGLLGIGCGRDVGKPRTGLDGLRRWAEVEGRGSVGEVGGDEEVEVPERIKGRGASNVTFGTDLERGLGEAGGMAGGDGGSTEVSRKSGRFCNFLWKAMISSSGVSLGEVTSGATSRLLLRLSRRDFFWWRLPNRKLWREKFAH